MQNIAFVFSCDKNTVERVKKRFKEFTFRARKRYYPYAFIVNSIPAYIGFPAQHRNTATLRRKTRIKVFAVPFDAALNIRKTPRSQNCYFHDLQKFSFPAKYQLNFVFEDPNNGLYRMMPYGRSNASYHPAVFCAGFGYFSDFPGFFALPYFFP